MLLLERIQELAGFVRLGWLGMLGSWSWLAWSWWRGREGD